MPQPLIRKTMKHHQPFRLRRPVLLAASVLSAVIGMASCSKDPFSMENSDQSDAETVGHDMIELGIKLENPYAVRNITKALENVSPTKAERTDITPTDMYVRFLPDSEEEYNRLVECGFNLMEMPLDYQIIKDGDYYHDPAVDEDKITWQYAVIPHDTPLPEGILCEILDDCYIPANDSTKSGDIDWDEVEREAYRITGNGDMILPETKASATAPKGRITIVDDKYADGREFGLAGVKIVCNSFVKIATAYTDRDGYYEMSKKYSTRLHYRILFKNSLDFAIGFNKIIIPASMSTLGKGPSEGIDYTITDKSDRKMFCRSVVNNTVYDYISRCNEDDLDIPRPPQKLRIWIFQEMDASSAPMLRHGALLGDGIFRKFLGDYSPVLGLFMPDITIGAKGAEDYSTIYSRTCHELAHASHFVKAGKDYWNRYIEYVITSFVTGGGVVYGDGTGNGSGECCIGEMWGYFMQSAMTADRYGGEMPSDGLAFWFRPHIFRYLYERGFSRADIFSVLGKDVNSLSVLKAELIENFPEQSDIITQVFTRYSD